MNNTIDGEDRYRIGTTPGYKQRNPIKVDAVLLAAEIAVKEWDVLRIEMRLLVPQSTREAFNTLSDAFDELRRG